MVKIFVFLLLTASALLADTAHRRQHIKPLILLDADKEVYDITGMRPPSSTTLSNWWSYPYCMFEPDSTHGFSWVSNTINGHAAMTLTGTRFMGTPANAMERMDNFTAIFVTRTANGIPGTILSSWDSANSLRAWAIAYVPTGSNSVYFTTDQTGAGSVQRAVYFQPPPIGAYYVATLRKQNGHTAFFTNGVEQTPKSQGVFGGMSGRYGCLGIGGLGTSASYTASWQDRVGDVIIWNYPLNDLDRIYWEGALGAKAGITVAASARNIKRQLVFDGDSITAGVGAAVPYPTTVIADIGQVTNDWANVAVPGQNLVTCNTNFMANIYPMATSGGDNIYIIFAGTNDLKTGAGTNDVWQAIAFSASRAKSYGYKVIQLTILPRSDSDTPVDFDTNRMAINQFIRDNSTLFDAIADVGADTTIGLTGQETNGTYYQDLVHLTTAGNNIVAGIVEAVLSGM